VEQTEISKGLISDVCIKLCFSRTTYWNLALRSLFYLGTTEISMMLMGEAEKITRNR
jgi:hypothetical protein